MDVTQVQRHHDLGKLLASRGLLGFAADVGVATGRTALLSLQWGFGMVYLVDVWARIVDGQVEADDAEEAIFQECMKTLGNYKESYVVLRGLSHEMAQRVLDHHLGFVYLDACHEYEYVKRDLQAWYPKLRSGVGTIMAGHDYSNPGFGVKRAVDEFVAALDGVKLHVLPGGGELDATFWFEKP